MKNLSLLCLLFLLFSCELEDPAAPGILVPRTVDQDISLPSLAINGTQLHVETFGQATNPMIIMVHGGPGGDYRSLLSAEAFAQEGFFVVFYDQRGSGLSKREAKNSYTADPIGLMVEDLNALINHYRQSQEQQVFLIGHSWGAMLSTAYINTYLNKISGAVLAEPGGFDLVSD